MDYIKCIILYCVINLSVSQPVIERKKSVHLKIPKEITNGTFISIGGEMNNVDGLYISISGKATNERCNIIFKPASQTIKVISETENDVPYNLHHKGNDPVPFTLNITARTVIDHTINNFLDLDFEGNEAGPELLPPCDIKFFNSLQHINIKGIQHLRSMLFVFDKDA